MYQTCFLTIHKKRWYKICIFIEKLWKSIANILQLTHQIVECHIKIKFSPLVFSGVRVARSLVLCVMFCRSLFILLFFFFWPLCRLSFLDLRILITTLVSSNSSWSKTLMSTTFYMSYMSIISILESFARDVTP